MPARRRSVRRTRIADIVPVPAPVGGLNTRDSKALMPLTDAVAMDNYTPGEGKVSVRLGITTHQSSVGSGNVDTIAEFHAGSTRKLLAASNGNVYDATAAPSSLVSGLTVDRWQTATLNSKIGFVNGTDAPQEYDGSTWGAMTLTGTGLTPANVIGIVAHRSRTYFWEENSATFWYSATGAMGGALGTQFFPLADVGVKGNIVCAGSWNVEGGDSTWGGGGVGEDMIVFVMSSGAAVVYRGSDPNAAADPTGNDFQLVGVYEIGEPVDVRGICRRGSDLLVLTTAGVVSMSAVVRSGVLNPIEQPGDKIRPTVTELVDTYKSNTGWELTYWPAGGLIVLNVPISATEFEQYVLNTKTGAWGRWSDIPARCWGVYNDAFYAGDTGANVEKLTGDDDNGTAIAGDLQTAYSAMGSLGTIKRVAAIRANYVGKSEVSVGIAPQFDFELSNVTPITVTFGPAGVNIENQAVLFEEADFVFEGSSATTFAEWDITEGAGYYVGARIRSSTTAELSLETITYQVEIGEGLIS